jgi:hypothetical protein
MNFRLTDEPGYWKNGCPEKLAEAKAHACRRRLLWPEVQIAVRDPEVYVGREKIRNCIETW